MASIRANVRLVAALLSSLPVCAAIALPGARFTATHLPAFTQKGKSAESPQMERLIAALAGEWNTEDTYAAKGHASRPHMEHAREDYRAGPGRRSLIEEYHGDPTAGQNWGTGIFWWDDKAQGVHILWCDSDDVAEGCRILSGIGKWEGNDFVQTDVKTSSGKQVFSREVWSDIKPDSFTQTIYEGPAADKLKMVLIIRATRTH